MVDVTAKPATHRVAIASGTVTTRADVLDKIIDGSLPKGDVLPVARVAGIQAAKRTSDLIPLCHPLSLSSVKIDFLADHVKNTITITAEVKALDRTGVEMEAMTAVSVAALTIYDTCKALQRDITLGPFVLLEKKGGKSGHYKRND